MVDFDNEINSLDDVWTHKLVGAHVGTLEDVLPILVGVLEELVYIVSLKLRFSRNHVTKSFINH